MAREQVRCSQRAASLVLCLRGGGEDHARHTAAELKRGGAHAASRRMDHHHLPGLERAELDQIEPGGEERLGNGGGFLEGEVLRNPHRLGSRYAGFLRIASPCQQRHHPVSALVRTRGVLDLSSDLETDDPRLARTRTIRSPSRGLGSGTSPIWSTSGPPGCLTTMARMPLSII